MSEVIKVVGVTFSNEDGKRRQDLLGPLYDDWWTEGREREVAIVLRAEPDNPVDPNAVGVWIERPEALAGRLGYLSRADAVRIGARVRLGRTPRARIADMRTGSGGGVSLAIRVRWPKVVRDAEGREYDLA